MMLKDIFDLLLLRGKPIAQYSYPLWKTGLLLTLIGAAQGLDPQMGAPNMPKGMVAGISMVWAVYPVVTWFLYWWLERGERWNGEGNLFALVVLASAIDILYPLGSQLGLPIVSIALFVYSLVVIVFALSKGVGVSRGYALAGVLLATVPAIIVMLFAIFLLGLAGLIGQKP